MSTDTPIYLDHNATTPLLPEVFEAMLPYLRDHFGNPSSGHVFGAKTHAAIERAREQVATLLGCDSDEIFFTSGGTEASNIAIRGSLAGQEHRAHIVTTHIEHPATSRPCAWLERQGSRVTRLRVDTQGRARLDDAAAAFASDVSLLSVMHSNNETGVLQPVSELTTLARAAGARIHVDAAQSIAKVPVNVRALDIDLLSIAGHKLYAPKGVGALFKKRGLDVAPLVLGAGHERGLRPGTENVASIVGLGIACDIAARDLRTSAEHMQHLRDRLWDMLAGAIPGLVLHGHPTLRLPNTLNVRAPGIQGDVWLAQTPEVAASTGSACHEGQTQASAVIVAMGVGSEEALGAVRLTLGRHTSVDEIDRAAHALIDSWRTLDAQRKL